eukprot:scaffold22436_cov107-Isochrysis_galbana.AAC.3
MEVAVRERQRGNPQFAFLFGGEGADFYRECLFKFAAELAPGASAPAGGAVSQQPAPPPARRPDPSAAPARGPGAGVGTGAGGCSRAAPAANTVDATGGGVTAGGDGRGRDEPRRPSRTP